MTEKEAVGMAFFTVALLLVAAFLLGALLERRRQARRAEDERARAEELRRVAFGQEQARAAAKPQWMRSTQAQPGTAGFTIAAALNGIGCLGRSQADEPVFVLCARDKAASMTVRDWAALAEKLGAKPAKVDDARVIADLMERWREQHGGGKVPD